MNSLGVVLSSVAGQFTAAPPALAIDVASRPRVSDFSQRHIGDEATQSGVLPVKTRGG